MAFAAWQPFGHAGLASRPCDMPKADEDFRTGPADRTHCPGFLDRHGLARQ
ncbi:hypothetical protein ADP8_05075 [Roseomonas mucosa]|nr:hypothetical protein ADP8_05075 [Roseomonas mucosa]